MITLYSIAAAMLVQNGIKGDPQLRQVAVAHWQDSTTISLHQSLVITPGLSQPVFSASVRYRSRNPLEPLLHEMKTLLRFAGYLR